MSNNSATVARSATSSAVFTAPRPADPLLSSASRSCCECGGRFVPSDYAITDYVVEPGSYGQPVYTCPDCCDELTITEVYR